MFNFNEKVHSYRLEKVKGQLFKNVMKQMFDTLNNGLGHNNNIV